jgi:ABC-2 type transport system permease protein
MDTQNEPFPVQTTRDVGGLQVTEIQAINYPFFVDVRPDAMDTGNPIQANLPAVTMNWVSPVVVDEAKNEGREVSTLLRSSPNSWLRTDVNIQPDLQLYPEQGFPIEGTQQSYPLAVAVQGSFDSYFRDKASPLSETAAEDGDSMLESEGPAEDTSGVGTIDRSPDTSRLVVIGSAEFLNDFVFNLSAALSADLYLNSLQFAQNSVDWSVEDLSLLGIRSRGTSTRVLSPLVQNTQSFWEGLNYVLAVLALAAIAIVWQMSRRREKPMELVPREEITTQEEQGLG